MSQSVQRACNDSVGLGMSVGEQKKAEENSQHPGRFKRACQSGYESSFCCTEQVGFGADRRLDGPERKSVNEPGRKTELRIGKPKLEVAPGHSPRGLRIRKAPLNGVALLELRSVRRMRRMQECASASGSDLLISFWIFVTTIVVQVTREIHPYFVVQKFIEELQITLAIDVRVVSAVGRGIDPVRLGVAQNDAIAGLQVLVGNLAEIVDLRLVDVRPKLDIRSQDPPPARELYCEIAARLVSLPAGEPSPLRKQSRKRHEAVVPIVIA